MSESKKSDRSSDHLANERTFLAWLRTSIALMGLGFVVARFSLFLKEFGIITKNQIIPSNLPSPSSSTMLGMSMIGLGILLIIYALINYLKTQKAIEAGIYVPRPSIIYLSTIVIAVFGVITIAYLVIISR